MVLKGNLLFNGDFETGTTEGWECGPYELTCDYNLTASEEARYRGSYGGLLTAQEDNAAGFLAYNKVCSFEEYEAYLAIMYIKLVSGLVTTGVLYGLDDKNNLINYYRLGWNMEENIWRKYVVLLRGFRDITHFQIGLHAWGSVAGDKVYIDEAKLIPLCSIKGHEIKEYRNFNNVTSNKEWYSVIACVGKTKLRSVLQVVNVSGSSPTLDTKIECYVFDGMIKPLILEHSQFTNDGIEQVTIDLPDVSYIKISYTVGGTSPSFDIYHHIILEPY